MTQYGDVTFLNGAYIRPVDVLIGGSPCQDLSIAGNRAGLEGERSGLFLHQIRIAKEMRESELQNGCPAEYAKPRYLIWENVPGAFSSNKGKDFQTVLTEIVRVVAPKAPAVPMPESGWPNAGCLMGNGWSVAWRVHNAQYWGVPQRRRRIALVADFGGDRAGKILFEQSGLCGDTAESSGTRPNPSSDAGKGVDTAIDQIAVFENHSQDSRYKGPLNVCPMLPAQLGTGGNNTPLVMAHGQANAEILEGQSPTLNCDHEQPIVCLDTVRRMTPLECERLQGYPDNWTNIPPMKSVSDMEMAFWRVTWNKWCMMNHCTYKTDKQIKRWLAKPTSDSVRYKALGNSLALPFWQWLAKRMVTEAGRRLTMGSLFDGIGGFPLVWERVNGKGYCKWTSEVDPFPIMVTRYRFKEEE